MSTTLPYLKSEAHFRKYESYVAKIVDAWPKLSVFVPTPPIASVETLSSRIRICVASLRENQWPTLIPMHTFMQIVDEIVVSTHVEPGKVVCGPYAAIKRLAPHKPCVEDTLGETQPVPIIRLENPPHDLVDAIVVLHHYAILSEPSHIKTDKDMSAYTKLFDVSVAKDGDYYVIL